MTCVGRIEHSPENVWCADQNFGFSCIASYGILVGFGSTTVSGVGLSAGQAMDSGTMSLSGVVAWSGDSGSLFMELSGAF
ncbi:hypothetical protein DY000_02015140 [Brassica cretica]|uniref:Xylanase inhibitor N-terminal domain-containing protein n=1 Tax=Brassica cretica TaxID=69181 RepID=A0ABQ7D490_BRACR|nr:hypothetical protein DY000_02015140 [Brassica cretica]